jgi:hypothetical protein
MRLAIPDTLNVQVLERTSFGSLIQEDIHEYGIPTMSAPHDIQFGLTLTV